MYLRILKAKLMRTLKQVSNLFNVWVAAHRIMNTYGFGDTSDISTSDITYPLFYCKPDSTPLYKLSFDIYLADILEDDKTNLETVMSGMLSVVYDFTQYLETYKGLDIDMDTINISPFIGDFDDLTAGWIISISMDYINPKDC